MPAPLLIPAIMGASALAKTGIGLAQASRAKKDLEELGKIARPKYETGEALYDRADAKATGLTPEERARAMQQFSQLNNTRFSLATRRNPTLTGAVQAGINYGSPAQALGLAAQDAQLRRQNLSQLLGVIGRQSNLQSSQDIDYRNRTEMALGAGHSRGVENVSKGLDAFSNAAAFGVMYGKGGTPPVGGGYGTTTQTISPVSAANTILAPQPQQRLRTTMSNPNPYGIPYNTNYGQIPYE